MAKLKSSAKPKTANVDVQAKLEGASRSLVDSAQQIWLAGMGAFARAQEEGSKLFDSLVREGSSLEESTRRMATGRVDAVRGAVETGVGSVRERAVDTWDRLEKVFEDRVQRALNGLGVPGREEIELLSARVEALTREVRRLGGTTTTPAAAATKRPSARPATPKAPVARRKTAARKSGAKKKTAG